MFVGEIICTIFNNNKDPYAIQIVNKKEIIGYNPQSYSKFISTEIDKSHTKYEIKVINILTKKDLNEVIINITKKILYYV